MKKVLFIMSVFIVFVLETNIVLGYSNEYFKVDIPSNYSFTENEESNQKIYNFQNENNYISISVTPYSGRIDFDIDSKETLEKFANQIQSSLQQQLNTEIIIISKNIDKIGKEGYKSIVVKLRAKDYDVFQKTYSFFTKKNIYNISISSNDGNFLSSKDVNSLINSFEENNSVIEKDSTTKFITEACSIIILILIGAIVNFINKKRKQVK